MPTWRWRFWRFAWAGPQVRQAMVDFVRHTGYPLRRVTIVDEGIWSRLIGPMFFLHQRILTAEYGRSMLHDGYAAWKRGEDAQESLRNRI